MEVENDSDGSEFEEILLDCEDGWSEPDWDGPEGEGDDPSQRREGPFDQALTSAIFDFLKFVNHSAPTSRARRLHLRRVPELQGAFEGCCLAWR